jgi:hypothetical protein
MTASSFSFYPRGKIRVYIERQLSGTLVLHFEQGEGTIIIFAPDDRPENYEMILKIGEALGVEVKDYEQN